MMVDDYGIEGTEDPGTFVFLQLHPWDSHQTAWQTSRASFYGAGGTPDAWFDGVVENSGSYDNVTQDYNRYRNTYLSRLSVPTDVTIQINAGLDTGSTYNVAITVGIEPGGTGKTMRIYLVQVLDHWPTDKTYHRNGFKQAASTADITVAAGGSEVVERSLTFDGDSVANEEDIKLIAWAQEPVGSGPADVYQAAVSAWPFAAALGDMDGSGVVNVDDADDFVLALVNQAAYEAMYPDIDPEERGDVNQDGFFNAGDIQLFVAAILGLDVTPPTPNPMTFAVLPACGYYGPTTEIQMQATTATDPTTPVSYKFEGALGAHDRVPEWAGGTWYTDTGLTPNTEYGYRVQAKDGANNPNTFSDWAYTATEIETPESLTGDPIQSDSITVTANGTFTNLTEGSSGLLFKWWGPGSNPNVDPPFDQEQVQDTVVTADGLASETTYTFRVWGINRNGTQNGSYEEDQFTTTAP
ncbi:MAG: hypothetical protein JXQ75_10360 [Phycisphaerae bacterium]|nr:hypothetical protein [Phycisphaerae bacterium]